LLVLLLPALGLLAGLLLLPTVKPRWERRLEQDAKCAGIVTIEGQPQLIIHGGRVFSGNQAFFEIISLDLDTGSTLFTRKIDDDGQSKMELLPGTTHALFQDKFNRHSRVTVKDWMQNVDIHQGVLPVDIELVRSLSYQDQVLIADLHLGDKNTAVAIWRFDQEQPVEPLKFVLPGMGRCDIRLSADGNWAVVSYSPLIRDGRFTQPRYVDLVDTRQGKIVQHLPPDIKSICWLPNHDSFVALQQSDKSLTKYWQRYDRLDSEFVPAGPQLEVISPGDILSPSVSPFVVVETKDSYDPLRRRLKELLGKYGDVIVDRYWPDMTVLELYQAYSGELLQSMSIPNYPLYSAGTTAAGIAFLDKQSIYPNPNGRGVILQSGQHFVYWQFDPARPWYPRVGLAFGFTFAILLARRNLRRTAAQRGGNVGHA
jgi:hypothetical protein